MRRIVLLIIVLFISNEMVYGQKIAFEQDPERNVTSTYEELIDFYKKIARRDGRAKLMEVGQTDVGKPLHLLVLSADRDFDPKDIKAKGKAVMLINNGIHPGEPEGIDASMMFVRDLLLGNKLPADVVICVVPVYNVSGMLDRGTSRANQNGPVSYGFRGSRQHYDLNRDFIKSDTRNAKLFQHVFHTWDPDIFFDTHTSNGADYQYVMTLIATHPDKLSSPLSDFMQEKFTAPLYKRMEKSGIPMIPYVNTKEETPESGLVAFLETPRYSTGYAALHHTIGYMPETHMWKPYEQRVKAMYVLLNHLLAITAEEHKALVQIRRLTREAAQKQEIFPLSWKLDTDSVDTLSFLGYRAGRKASNISGAQRLFYDRQKPTAIQIPYYHHYKPDVRVKKPVAYVIPQAYDDVIALLRLNGVQMRALERDTVLEVETYYIEAYQTSRQPYEGHYLHDNVRTRSVVGGMAFYAGDWIVETDQQAVRYIIETLEPAATDSFFNWNFFDAILSQKEYFAPYIFEEEAERLLKEHPGWRDELEHEKQRDEQLRQNGRLQLDWIYKKSAYYEKGHLRYPVARLLKSP
ncbi:MAG TPA: M14 family zinc carboxypeptidase [Sphingobacterium sp.]|jgi:hypothetical protein|nr:M14 family zinc carboxypeptidase [Sphingobacterium sp.]